MARKPLIEQGSILAGPDTLSRVISRDREQSGRQSPTESLPAMASSMEPSTEPSTEPSEAAGQAQPLEQVQTEETPLVNELINEQTNKRINKSTDKLTNKQNSLLTNIPAERPALDALTQAYLTSLSQPIPAINPKSPRVLVAGRVQTEVSERFEVVCTMLKKRGDKQDVLNKALKLLIDHVVQHQGDIDL